MTDGRWFSARILMEAVHPDEDSADDKLFEDKILLVRADSEERARAKAKKLGQAEESEYLNADGNRVNWRFRGILDLVLLFDEPRDGAEVYYGFLGEADVTALRRALDAGHLGADKRSH